MLEGSEIIWGYYESKGWGFGNDEEASNLGTPTDTEKMALIFQHY